MPGSRWVAVAVVAALAGTAACGSGSAKKASSATTTGAVPSPAGGVAVAGDVAPPAAQAGRPLTEAAAGATTTVAAASETTAARGQAQTALRAGSVDDNDKFSDYLEYRRTFAASGIKVHDVDVSERHIFTVTGGGGKPVLGAHITISEEQGNPIAELRTYADGRAFFFPKAYKSAAGADKFTATVEKDGKQSTVAFERTQTANAVTLDASPQATPVKLDVEFLVDATGSMGDEIGQLKSTMVSIAERIHSLGAKPDVRFAMTTYRDRSDAYVTKTFPFTADIDAFVSQLQTVQADGGGDTPESVNAGLHDALNKVQWRGDNAVKLVLLVGDAPPHLDYTNDADYAVDMLDAAARGIKIHSLAASGLDDQGEYIFRQIAEATEGQFVFLTYNAEGGPGDSTPHHVSGYTPQSLDDLIVKLVSDEVQRATKGQ